MAEAHWPDPSSPTGVNFHRRLPHLLFTARQGQPCYSVRYSVLMNSDEFKLIFGSDTESEKDYIFAGFSEQDLIMGDTNSSSKRHSKTKRTLTVMSSVQENVEAAPQYEHCVRSARTDQNQSRSLWRRIGLMGLTLV